MEKPWEIEPELMKKVLGDEKPIEGRFADTLPMEFDKVKEEINDFAKTDEDVLSYILFPQIAEKFFKEKNKPKVIKVNYSIRKA